jgi:hypothetical protein
MIKQLQALYGLKWNPFTPDAPLAGAVFGRPAAARLRSVQNHDPCCALTVASRPQCTLATLLTPLPSDEMEAYGVSTLVNSPRNDTPECIARVGVGSLD